MRLQNLDLIRYGKFTDTKLLFPSAKHDFHVIVGPNEAGKSTVRQAVSELLFGIPVRSSLGFKHALSELRLGATVENATGHLVFERAKAQRGTLRSSSDAVLPDDVLTPFIGAADKTFFEQMFGLGHAQLVEGGQSILDASKDVGQVLFQSATGIASLAKVRDELMKEAAELWAPRKSDSRVYYAALQRFTDASEELKTATVRTRAWEEAHKAFVIAQQQLEDARKAYGSVESQRTLLERVRRVSPHLARMAQDRAELLTLGEVLVLPDDALTTLTEQESNLSSASEEHQLRQQDVQRLQQELLVLVVEDGILERRSDIEALEALRHRFSEHEPDLVLRRKEVQDQLTLVLSDAGNLAWPADEQEIRDLMPSALSMKTIRRLAQEKSGLQQATQLAASAVHKKQKDAEALQEELTSATARPVSAELREAISQALGHQNTAAKQQTLKAAVGQAERGVEQALSGLGQWQMPIAQLARLCLPSNQRLSSLTTERQQLKAAVASAQERLEDAQEEWDASRFAVEQFVSSRDVVEPEHVKRARQTRDDTWRDIKLGAPLESRAAELDVAIAHADGLIDRQLVGASDAAELHALKKRFALAEQAVQRQQHALKRREDELRDLDEQWDNEASGVGLPGMRLEDLTAWESRRQVALAQEALRAQKEAELQLEVEQVEASRQTLLAALASAGVESAAAAQLGPLLSMASEHVRSVDSAVQARDAAHTQLQQALQSLRDLEEEQQKAQEAYASWERDWNNALREMRLDKVASSVQQAESAVELVGSISDLLTKIDITRSQRIDTMEADLARFRTSALELGKEVDESLLSLESPVEIAKSLARRLRDATAAQQTRATQQSNLQNAEARYRQAEDRVREAKAKLRPLLELAGVSTPAELHPLVVRSDRNRELLKRLDEARDQVLANGDGLSLEAIEAEVANEDLTTLVRRLETLKQEAEEATRQLTALGEARLRAEQTLMSISGQANAAVAEGKRQEALSALADASERYVKVATANKLLRWAIDRYRDRKQGPLLSRASELFNMLTLGRFKRLIVDYEQQPPSLGALRVDGLHVQVDGMSEGTVDQLYLALRLAALELHMEKATPMPFIADDLFINFDDERARAGLEALKQVSTKTQVLFLTHHDHYLPLVRTVFGQDANVVELER
jgi:chromosome segregation protein